MIAFLLALMIDSQAGGPAARPPKPPPAAASPKPVAQAPAPAPAPAGPALASPWRSLETGLDLGEFSSTLAAGGDGLIHVLRIDPGRWRLRLLNASAQEDGKPRTARAWAKQEGLAAAINASMYQSDFRTSVSLMRAPGHVNNPRLSKDKAVLAFDPDDPSLPPVQIIDRECQTLETLGARYGSLVQSIRMVSCAGRNVWSPQERAWSTAAIGVDRQGRVLFIHARAPYTTHNFIEALLALPVDLKNAMYAEGGHEAQMFVNAGGRQFEYLGGADDGSDDGLAGLAWPIPNVIGIVPIGASR
ncbi:MAG TPA: phosphodiester glycosidase family protein [Patescibacteria group bacterium]|nr:phosphodiester glycosidase family protein [Patescibacteria group bacterium]